MVAYILLNLRDENGPVTVGISIAILLFFCLLQWFVKLASHKATELVVGSTSLSIGSTAEVNGRNTRDILTSFYQTHNPSKVGEVDKIMNKYAGHEDKLFVNLAKMYNVDPKQFDLKTAVSELPA